MFFLLFFIPSLAAAHEVHVSAVVEGSKIRGEAYFEGDRPVREGVVKALDPLGEILAETKTDAEGKFTLPARYRCDYRVLVDAGGGHGGEAYVEAEDLPADLPPRAGVPPAEHGHAPHAHAAADSAAPSDELHELQHEIEQLHRALDHYESKRRLTDVLGGIGYIFGLAGVGMYVLSLRKRKG
jgi:nickel transport protein